MSASIEPAGNCMQPGERDRQHEHVDREQVQRKQPDRLHDMALVDVLDHADLELARQEQDRHHRQEDERRPGAVGTLAAAERQAAARILGSAAAPAKMSPKPSYMAKVTKSPTATNASELDQRLEGDGGDHPLVPLGGIEVARTEHDGERGEQQRHVQRRVAPRRSRPPTLAGTATSGYCSRIVKLLGHRLQLQRDVRNDADHRDRP